MSDTPETAEREESKESNQTTVIQSLPLARFARAWTDAHRRRKVELLVQPISDERRFMVELLGVLPGSRTLLISAPAAPDRTHVALRQGQVLSCRWLNSSIMFHFQAAVTRLAMDPVPMLYIGPPHVVQATSLRELPRARVAIPATLRWPRSQAALLTDLSVGGARVGLFEDQQPEVGTEAQLVLTAQLFGEEFKLDLPCRVASAPGALDPHHPQVRFYGVTFTEPTERTRLVLHGIVQEHLARESDRLGQLLLSEASSNSPGRTIT